MTNTRDMIEFMRYMVGRDVEPWQHELISRLAQERAGLRMNIDALTWEPVETTSMKLICAPTRQEAQKYLSAFGLSHNDWHIRALGEYIRPKNFTHAVVIFPKGNHVYEDYYDTQIMPRMAKGVTPLVL